MNTNTVALSVGGALWGAASAEVAVRYFPNRAVKLSASLLAVVAAVYPLARRSAGQSNVPMIRELASVLAWGTVAVASMKRSGPSGRRLVALGWATHGAFDLLHDRGEGSLLPRWYPALCAGFDVGAAAVLMARGAGLHGSTPRGRCRRGAPKP